MTVGKDKDDIARTGARMRIQTIEKSCGMGKVEMIE
jgi:hypothetical protein